MPEIKNEIPTDEELRMYLAESLRNSSMTTLVGYTEDPQQWHPEVAEALSYLSAHGAAFLTTVTETIFQASRRLNQLPRDSPFWRNTNLRPTIYKLPDHCQQVLKDNPNDVLSLLAIVVLDVASTGDFKMKLWTRLYHLKAVDMEFVAFAYMLLLFGGAPAEEFCMFLTETGSESEALPILREIRAKGGTMLSEWSGKVESLLRPR